MGWWPLKTVMVVALAVIAVGCGLSSPDKIATAEEAASVLRKGYLEDHYEGTDIPELVVSCTAADAEGRTFKCLLKYPGAFNIGFDVTCDESSCSWRET